MILTIGEFITWMVVMLLIFTQMILPWMQSRPMFPALRLKSRRLERHLRKELQQLGDEETVKDLIAQVQARRRLQLEQLERGTTSDEVKGTPDNAEHLRHTKQSS